MKKIFKFVLLALGLRYVLRLMDENVDIKIQIKKLRNELAKGCLPKFKKTLFI